jgi:predicted phage baseplate assembly protein
VNVFAVDAEAGTIRFGNGTRGRRPALGARIVANYDVCVGADGNVAAGAINGCPALPAGFTATNPVRTWGGAAAETPADGEKQVAAQIQHQDRAVTTDDFAAIALRTPGAEVGRVVVLPAYHPDLAPNEPGDAPGAVTLMVVPRFDPVQPDAPSPDRAFLDAVGSYLDPRRLVTTEVFLCGPTYKSIYISVGLQTRAGVGFAAVREAVRAALLAYLSPLPADGATVDARGAVFDNVTAASPEQGGWPLRKPVNALELAAVAARVPDVLLVRDLLLAEADSPAASVIPLEGLELPRVVGLSIVAGDPLDLDALRGRGPVTPPAQTVPVPVVPEECR